MTTITYADLVEARACEDQRDKFRAMFGDGKVPITQRNVTRAGRAGLDVGWAIIKLRLPFTGVTLGLYENGQPWYVERWRGGQRHGMQRAWYSDGQPRYVEPWRAGQQHGVARAWYSDGQPRYVEHWRAGVMIRREL